jgi:hypothetical protein
VTGLIGGSRGHADRRQYGTFQLGDDGTGDGVIHLKSSLPEVVAIGIEAWQEFRTGISGPGRLGGPHADITAKGRLHIVTPECGFTYQVFATCSDTDGWYFLARLEYTSSKYAEFLAGH